MRLIILVALLTIGCSGSVTKPTEHTPAIGLIGQSNAMLLRPFLAEKIPVTAYYGEVASINCWSNVGSCWLRVKPFLSANLDAIVWSQGEYDALITEMPIAEYHSKFSDLVARIRAESKSDLRVILIEMGPFFDNGRGGVLGPVYQQYKRDWVMQDKNAAYIPIHDLEFQPDQVHMTNQGYMDLADRILARVK
jgi:hypothetical protein